MIWFRDMGVLNRENITKCGQISRKFYLIFTLFTVYYLYSYDSAENRQHLKKH